MTTHPPGQESSAVRRAYDTVADLYAERLPDLRAEAPLELAMLDAFIAGVGEEATVPRVLDAGCGTGRISRHLTERGIEVTGIDLSPAMIDQARATHPGIVFSVAALEALPFDDEAYDGVLLWYSTIHTPASDQPAIFREVARVMRPGAQLIVGCQAGSGERDLRERYHDLGRDVALVRYRFTADEVAGWMAYAGLDEVARMVRRPVDGEGDDQAVLLARRPDA